MKYLAYHYELERTASVYRTVFIYPTLVLIPAHTRAHLIVTLILSLFEHLISSKPVNILSFLTCSRYLACVRIVFSMDHTYLFLVLVVELKYASHVE